MERITSLTIIMGILGVIIIVLGVFSMDTGTIINTIIIAFLPIATIVGIISGLGIIATTVKFIVEESVNEVKQTVFPAASLPTQTFTPPPPPQMATESARPVSIERTEEQKICPYCKAINPGDAKFCKVCGSRLL